MTQTYKKKLIEVAIPLEAINAASAREKSIRHGHPSTLHLWWARRPLAACRAVLFAQLVDDPSGYADELLQDAVVRTEAEKILPVRIAAWEKKQADEKAHALNPPCPTLADCAAEVERERLFDIIRDLVKWENSTNEEVLERARAEIRRSCGGVMPPVYDPFSGGGSIPLEAQRLGLPAYGSDLNPVAVMIGKAMIEIPPKFKDMPPIHPGIKERSFYRNAEGLAEDVKHYGGWVRAKAWERIGHLYPKVELPKEYGGAKATVIGWIWARTVPSPDPAFADVQVPITSSFLLNSKPGKETWVEPIINRASKSIQYRIRRGGTKSEIAAAKEGTKAGRAVFRCLMSGSPVSGEYIDSVAASGKMKAACIAVVVDAKGGRVYVPFEGNQADASLRVGAVLQDLELSFLDGPCRGTFASNAQGRHYGIFRFRDYFNDRQVAFLTTIMELLEDLRNRVRADAATLGRAAEASSDEYADAVHVYMAMSLSRLTDSCNAHCRWAADKTQLKNMFSRQAIQMSWDYFEANPFSGSAGDFFVSATTVAKAVERWSGAASGSIANVDAQSVKLPKDAVISTDPPYYDNIEYADLSDFFYPWMRRALRGSLPELFGVLSTPKAEELVATRYRHGGQNEADAFFLQGMRSAISRLAEQSNADFPAAIYYAFKQSEIDQEGISSTGWATFLQAVLEAGYAVVGTWPMRTEMANRMVASGTNALANSVVLVCRKKEATAEVITRAEFVRALKRELPPAIAELQAANIAPADMPQSAIGPGMGVFSRHKAVLEADDSPMSVKTALQLVNRELDEYLGGIQGEFDADTRFAITWFEQNGNKAGEYGAADNLARARGTAVESARHARILAAQAGKVRLLNRDEIDPDWLPETDHHLTVWECCQQLVRLHEAHGIGFETAAMLKRLGGDMAERVKDLAYVLQPICDRRGDAKEATAYNALIADWAELSREAATVSLQDRASQLRMEV